MCAIATLGAIPLFANLSCQFGNGMHSDFSLYQKEAFLILVPFLVGLILQSSKLHFQ